MNLHAPVLRARQSGATGMLRNADNPAAFDAAVSTLLAHELHAALKGGLSGHDALDQASRRTRQALNTELQRRTGTPTQENS